MFVGPLEPTSCLKNTIINTKYAIPIADYAIQNSKYATQNTNYTIKDSPSKIPKTNYIKY